MFQIEKKNYHLNITRTTDSNRMASTHGTYHGESKCGHDIFKNSCFFLFKILSQIKPNRVSAFLIDFPREIFLKKMTGLCRQSQEPHDQKWGCLYS